MENEVKEPAPKYNYISPEEYLEMERASDVKHEYHDGEIFAMAGASMRHNHVFHNVYVALGNSLKGKNCKPFNSDLRIHIPEKNLYTYPDISIICGKPETTDLFKDNVKNPAVIIEILSKSTKGYDKGAKFTLYRHIKTLKEYILIDSDSALIELYVRQPDNSWNLTEYSQQNDNIYIPSIGTTLFLSAIYEDINFEE